MSTPLRSGWAYVPLEEVEWLPECATQDTPESILIDREEELASGRPREQAAALLYREDKRLGIAYRLTAMDRPLSATYVGSMFGLTPDAAADLIRGAHARHGEIVAGLRRAGT